MSFIKEYTLWVAVFTLALLPIVSVSAPEEARYWAGYYYYGYEHFSAPPGVQGDIKTISHTVSGHSNWYAEWVSIVLEYYPNHYWIQIGFDKKWYQVLWWWELRLYFYKETMDSNGHSLSHMGGPQHVHYYNYQLKMVANYYSYLMKEGTQTKHSGYLYPNPYESVDIQAAAETTSDDIWITDSHLKNLKYGPSWDFWNRYVPRSDSPYWLGQVSHYRFYPCGPP